jgi:hypothetical protein
LYLIFSCLILAGASVDPLTDNPNYFVAPAPVEEDGQLSGSWHENSIWPTIGKGIWVGLLMIGTGILAILSKFDGSWISIHVFNILAWTTLIFSLFLILSAILSVEVYRVTGVNSGIRVYN